MVKKEKGKVRTQEVAKPAVRTAFKVSKEPYEVAVPANFDFKTYKPLKKKNFKDEVLFYEHKGAEMAHKRNVFLAKAEEIRKLGSPADRRAKKQILRLQTKMSELKKQLTDQGIDVDELLKTAAANQE